VSELLETTGQIIYDPNRFGMKRRTEWWCVVVLDNDLARYYRWMVSRRYFGRTTNDPTWLKPPAWGAHVSVVRGERPRNKYIKNWKKRHKEIITIKYDPTPRQVDVKNKEHFWFIDAYSDDVMNIRNELGLPTHYKFHITIGRTV